MANEKRLIDAIALAKYLKEGHDYIMQDRGISPKRKWYEAVCFDRVRRAIEEEPTVDAVEVVRCKDCKCFEKMASNNSYFCNVYGGYVKEEDYCSRPQPKRERREGE